MTELSELRWVRLDADEYVLASLDAGMRARVVRAGSRWASEKLVVGAGWLVLGTHLRLKDAKRTAREAVK